MKRGVSIGVIAGTAIYMAFLMVAGLFPVRAQSTETRLAMDQQRIEELARRVSSVEAMNMASEIATIKEFQKNQKESFERIQSLIYGIFLAVATLAIERVWFLRTKPARDK